MIILSKKRMSLILVCIFVGIFTFMIQNANVDEPITVETVTLPVSGKVIVIDAGHRKTR